MIGMFGSRPLENIPKSRKPKEYKPSSAPDRRKTRRAVASLETFLREVLGLKSSQKVSVYTWTDLSGGARVIEISVVTRNGGSMSGCSWMRSDSADASVILAAEDFLISYGMKPEMFPGGIDVDDPHQDARDKLADIMK